jgi:hypothetical protein
LYSHVLHLQLDKEQKKIINDAAKFKKESEKARLIMFNKNRKKRKTESTGGHSEITTALSHEDEFSAVLDPQRPSKFNKDDFVTVKSDTTSGVHNRFFYEMNGIVQKVYCDNGKWKYDVKSYNSKSFERNIEEVWIQQCKIEKPLQEDRRQERSQAAIFSLIRKLKTETEKRILLRQKLKKNELSMAETIRQNDLLRNQNEKMASSIEELVNADFDELLRGRKLRTSDLRGHVQSKMRDVLQYALNKASDSNRLEFSLNEVKEAYELLKQELEYQEAETEAAIEEIKALHAKNAKLVDERGEVKRKQVATLRRLDRALKTIDGLCADNSKLTEEKEDDDGDFVQSEDRRYTARYKEHILRMFRIELSVSQVSHVLVQVCTSHTSSSRRSFY